MSKHFQTIVIAILSLLIIGASIAWLLTRNSVTIIVKSQPTQNELIKDANSVNASINVQVPNSTLLQMSPIEKAYVVTWKDRQNAYSGIYIGDNSGNGNIIVTSQQVLSQTQPTPTPTPSP